MAHVVLENLLKVYREKSGEVRAVDSINLEVRDREFMVLVGPSGCGKSTTLRMIAGLEEATAGSIAIDGRRVNDVPPRDRDIAMVFQNYALYPHMTVFENLAFGLKLRKVAAPEIDRRVREAASMLGLEAVLDRRPKALSGGQRQRVAVGRAIVRKPKVFLFDEPLSNLDARMRAATRAELVRLHASIGATMIYVTHDQMEAMTMGDRICVMKDGAIMQVDEPLALYDRPKNRFVGGFIGSPPMNFFQGMVAREANGRRFRETNGAGNALTASLRGSPGEAAAGREGAEVILGVRPEHVRIGSGPGGEGIEAEVELSEPMGAETFVHLTTGATRFIARAVAHDRFAIGDRVRVAIDPDRVHLFDPVSGDAIETGNV